MTLKLIWRVEPPPTGQYRSFERRGWPMAYLKIENDMLLVATISCDDEYTAKRAKSGQHAVLTLRVTDRQEKSFKWRTVAKRFVTLAEAKAGVVATFEKYPDFLPKSVA